MAYLDRFALVAVGMQRDHPAQSPAILPSAAIDLASVLVH